MTSSGYEPGSPTEIARLRKHVEHLVAVADGVFAKPIQFEATDHFAFMALNFAGKQVEHCRSVLILNDRMDAVLIARSMFEGLSQLLWASQAPDERPLRWRSFAFIRDWRTMRKQEAAGIAIDSHRKANVEDGLSQYGSAFLTPKAMQATGQSQPLPPDPYMRNWYGESEKDVFAATGGQLAYDALYGPFSEWHHWRIGGFGALIKFDEQMGRFQMTPSSPQFTASALASAFQCLWQTLGVLDHAVPGVIAADLDAIREEFIAECSLATHVDSK